LEWKQDIKNTSNIWYSSTLHVRIYTIISIKHQAKIEMKNQVDQVVKKYFKKDTNAN
jgi:hypothetical protein